jgi:hypothetical protein
MAAHNKRFVERIVIHHQGSVCASLVLEDRILGEQEWIGTGVWESDRIQALQSLKRELELDFDRRMALIEQEKSKS